MHTTLCAHCHEAPAREHTARGPRCLACAESLLAVPALTLRAPAVALPRLPRGWTHYALAARGAALALRVALARKPAANDPAASVGAA